MLVKFDEVSINSVAYEAGRSDDGHPFIAEAYEVCVTKPRGDRWVHPHVFCGCKVAFDDEGYAHFEDVRAEALRAALKLRRRIRRAGQIDANVWREGRPVYGSDAYCAYGQDDDVALERREEEEWR